MHEKSVLVGDLANLFHLFEREDCSAVTVVRILDRDDFGQGRMNIQRPDSLFDFFGSYDTALGIDHVNQQMR